ncbi:ABC transporter substrate-binding protein [Halomonas mongoliensis]|uniref:ABC transporter substrate-binding protein n=1 Tax=Halomonas mongoliensis TaxID=321265 RepID=UPI00403B0722
MKGVGLGISALLLAAVLLVALSPDRERTEREAGQRAGTVAGAVDAAALAERQGALLDEIVFLRETDLGRVTGLIEAGSHQLFSQGISSPTVVNRLRDSVQADMDLAFGTSSELTLNPAGPILADGSLNPFALPEIREALNWLVDRRHVAEELYGGLAVPRTLPLSTAFPDYARLAEESRALELRYAHDPDRAREAIDAGMGELGAERRAGRWFFDEEPVRLRLLIRTEDERRRVGDYLANLLQGLGFEVERRYRTAEEASRLWIATDPAAGEWHLYTGAWISIVIQRDQADNFSFYYTPRGRAEPLWQAYRPAPEFDELADRLSRRDYASWEERQAMMARALELALVDSSRVWLVDQLNASARAANVEVAADLAGGVSGSALWPYTLRYTDRLGGRLVVGLPGLLGEPWNPVAGSNWAFDRMITRATQDPVVLPDPYTGLYHPQRIARAELAVEAGIPVEQTLDWLTLTREAQIAVPGDAWVDWDALHGRFIPVDEAHPEGLTARTRVRVHYDPELFARRWHDGSWLTPADFVLPWILDFERASEASPLFDPAHLATFEAFRRHFRGWRILSTEPLVIEVYSDQIFPDAESIVAARAPSPLPWHVLMLGILGERRGELAFSSNKADRQRVDWLSLVAGPSLPVLERLLAGVQEQLQEPLSLPYGDALGDWLAPGEPERRFAALDAWQRAFGHFWVGSGPYRLHSVHPVEGSVVLRRFEGFRDPADRWLGLSRAPIPELLLDGPLVVAAGRAPGANGLAAGGREGREGAEFRLAVTVEGAPYPEEELREVSYLLFDGDGALAGRGEAEPLGQGQWRVRLDAETLAGLGSGANSLELAVISRRVALPAFASHVFATVPSGETVPPGEEVPR